MKRKRIWIGIVLIAFVGVGFYSFTQDEKNFEVAKNLDIYHTLFAS
jgi:carboxyl-terminal processing protease